MKRQVLKLFLTHAPDPSSNSFIEARTMFNNMKETKINLGDLRIVLLFDAGKVVHYHVEK